MDEIAAKGKNAAGVPQSEAGAHKPARGMDARPEALEKAAVRKRTDSLVKEAPMAETQDIEIRGRRFIVSTAEEQSWLWDHVKDGTFEPETFGLYEKVITGNTLYIDIGSWVGPTVLFGGTLAKRVVAVEPIAVSMASLLKNLGLNEQVLQKTELYNLAIGVETGTVRLYNNTFGDGMASILPSRGSLSMTFMAMGVEEFLDRTLGDEPHVFIKVDIEGGEFEVVPKLCASLKRRQIAADLYISVHGSFTEDARTRMETFGDNLAKHGRLLKALAEYGDLQFDFGDFKPIEHGWNSYLPMNDLQLYGGFDTAIFVKAR